MNRCASLVAGLAVAISAGSCGPSNEQAPAALHDAEVVAIPNAALYDGTVLVGGQPTQEDLAAAAEAGYVTVINLRPAGEFTDWDEQAEVEALGLDYVSIPVGGGAGVTRENAARLKAELDRAEGRPVLVHCASGNRVGALLALSAFHFEDLSPRQALELGLNNGLTSLESTVETYLQSHGEP